MVLDLFSVSSSDVGLDITLDVGIDRTFDVGLDIALDAAVFDRTVVV